MLGKKIPLWRQFEDASHQERESMVEWREVWVSSDGSTIAERFGNGVRLYGTPVTMEFFNGFVSQDSGSWKKKIKHNDKWIRVRNSFTNCKEWDYFRLQWLQTHLTCVRCGRTDGVLQVHHAGHYNQDSVVMEEGFLEGLKHPERFETLCEACHYAKHMGLIKSEFAIKKRNKETVTLTPKDEEEREKLMISSVYQCVDWAKEHSLKKVTEADVNDFLSERKIDISRRNKRRILRALVNSYVDWAKEHGLKTVTDANVDAFLKERHIDHSPSTKRGSKKESLNILVTPCVEWAKEHGLKRVTEANVDDFLLERDIDLSPRKKRRSLQASVNIIIKSTVL